MSDKQTVPQLLFLQQIKQMLAFWCQETSQIDNETMLMLEKERKNLYRAVQIGLQFAEVSEETAVVLTQAMPFITYRGYWQDWIPLLERCIHKGMFSHPAHHISLLICLGRAYRLDSQRDKAIATHLQAEQIATETKQQSRLGEIQHDLLEDYLFARLYTEAKQRGHRALTILAEMEASPALLANCYKMLGTVCYETEAFAEAEKYFSQAITRWRQMDDPVHLARTLNDLARLWLTLGRYDEAQNSLSEAAELLADTVNELDKCMIYINLGSVLAAQQQWARAETAFYQANSRYLRQSTDLPRRARVNNNLGYVLFRQEKHEVAEEYLQQALQLWQEMGDDLEYANTLSILADSWLAQGQPHVSLPMYETLLLKIAPYSQNGLARRLQEEYSVVYAQLREKAQAKQPA